MDNPDIFEKLVEIVVNNENKRIKIADLLPILDHVGDVIEEDKKIDIELANTIIFSIVAGLAIKLDFNKVNEVLADCIKDLKDSLS